MPYPQDLKGKFVQYTVDQGVNLSPAMAGNFVDGLLPGQTTNTTLSVYGPPPPLVGQHRLGPPSQAFINTNIPWTFTFLRYVGGAVTTAPLAGNLLTGPMSGCYLCKYTQNNQSKLAHIGTVNAMDSPESIAVKAAWRTFVARGDVSAVTGATPFDYYTTPELQLAFNATGRNPVVAGYFDAGGSAYALLLAAVPANKSPLLPQVAGSKILEIKPMTMQPWATIAALRTFRE